ncbi:MAG: Flagellar filament 30.7 kDa core protein [Phycisphaerae bacterium]|nr:Flagellar filament 30.7 kDa core protein [Phycisphaerae bacterium]
MFSPVSSAGSTSLLDAFRRSQQRVDESLLRLASGRRINRGSDDPAGLISATQLESAIAALEAEASAVQRVDAQASIADGHTGQISSMMGELNEKIVAAGNSGALSDAEREAYQLEIDSLVSSIQRAANAAGESLASIQGHSGAPEGMGDTLSDAVASLSSIVSGGDNSLASGNLEAAATAVESALTSTTSLRGSIGAFQKHTLGARLSAIETEHTNLLEAHSRIVDVDYAEEISNLWQARAMTSAGIAVLRAARHRNEQVLSLLA